MRIRIGLPPALTRWPDPEDTEAEAAEVEAYQRRERPRLRLTTERHGTTERPSEKRRY